MIKMVSPTQSSRAESQHWRKSRGNRTCRRYIIFSMISSVCLTLCYLDLLHKSDSQIDWADHWKNNVMTTCPVSPGFPPVLWLGPAGLWVTEYKHPSQVQLSTRTGSLCSRQNTCLKSPYCSDRGTRHHALRLAVSVPELTGPGHHNTCPNLTTWLCVLMRKFSKSNFGFVPLGNIHKYIENKVRTLFRLTFSNLDIY